MVRLQILRQIDPSIAENHCPKTFKSRTQPHVATRGRIHFCQTFRCYLDRYEIYTKDWFSSASLISQSKRHSLNSDIILRNIRVPKDPQRLDNQLILPRRDNSPISQQAREGGNIVVPREVRNRVPINTARDGGTQDFGRGPVIPRAQRDDVDADDPRAQVELVRRGRVGRVGVWVLGRGEGGVRHGEGRVGAGDVEEGVAVGGEVGVRRVEVGRVVQAARDAEVRDGQVLAVGAVDGDVAAVHGQEVGFQSCGEGGRDGDVGRGAGGDLDGAVGEGEGGGRVCGWVGEGCRPGGGLGQGVGRQGGDVAEGVGHAGGARVVDAECVAVDKVLGVVEGDAADAEHGGGESCVEGLDQPGTLLGHRCESSIGSFTIVPGVGLGSAGDHVAKNLWVERAADLADEGVDGGDLGGGHGCTRQDSVSAKGKRVCGQDIAADSSHVRVHINLVGWTPACVGAGIASRECVLDRSVDDTRKVGVDDSQDDVQASVEFLDKLSSLLGRDHAGSNYSAGAGKIC